MMTSKSRLMVLISGNGSNLQALIDACETKQLPATIVGVVSNRAEAYGLQRAEQHDIPTMVYQPEGHRRAAYDAMLGDLVSTFKPDWVILAGWMRILSMNFLSRFPQRVVNLHPALPGQFPGLRAIERAYQAAQQGEINQTGVMVHLVPDEGVDNGPVLASQPVPIQADDTLASLQARIHAVEHRLLVETVRQLVTGTLS